MDDKKIQITFRMDDKTNYLIKSLYEDDNCLSQNEFIEKAINFYASYIWANKNLNMINTSLLNSLRAAIKENENRTSSNIFKLSLEMSIMMNILAKGMDLPDEYIRELRHRCYETIKKQKGKYTFEDALHDANNFDGDEEY